ncbi:MAG TPA: C4-type zinc ribbon domain-containing protein [Patescibacteria group bacterium]|nr:C4-type zinc ribbon domain-containing protein [Patescibacteria group bacterium]
MLQDLERLVELQGLDAEIAELDAAAAAIPVQIRIMEQQLAQAKAALDAATAEVEKLQKLRRQKERDLDETSRELKKRQGRLFEIKTNLEYTAVLKEVEGLKQKISTLEEEVLACFDDIDAAAKIRDQEEEETRVTQAEFLKNKQQREGELREFQGRLSILRRTREGRSGSVEASLLQLYLRLLKSRDGLAVAQVINRSCEGCHVTITPQLYLEVRRNVELHTCEGCGRILYWKG